MKARRSVEEDTDGEYVRVASVSDLPVGGIRRFVVDGEVRVLVRTEAGVVRALDGICTHQELELAEGELEEDVLWCPFHGSGFNVHTGTAECLPAVDALQRYEVRADGDDIFVAKRPIPDRATVQSSIDL